MRHCTHYCCVMFGRGLCSFRSREYRSEKACIKMIELTSRLTAKHKREMRDYMQAVIELDERKEADSART